KQHEKLAQRHQWHEYREQQCTPATTDISKPYILYRAGGKISNWNHEPNGKSSLDVGRQVNEHQHTDQPQEHETITIPLETPYTAINARQCYQQRQPEAQHKCPYGRRSRIVLRVPIRERRIVGDNTEIVERER